MPNPAKANQYTDTATSTKANHLRLVNFVKEAWSHIGEDGTWTWSNSGVAQKPTPWCAAFVTACARRTGGMLNNVIYPSASCSSMLKNSVDKRYGTMVSGARLGKYTMPQQGDLVFYRWKKSGYDNKYSVDHVGIVCYVYENTFVTVEGNLGGENDVLNKVESRERDPKNTNIYCYYRPDWGKLGLQTNEVGDPVSSITLDGYYVGIGDINPLFDYTNDTDDAELREVYYMGTNGKLQAIKSDVRISVINYTSVLSSVYDVLSRTNPQSTGMESIITGDIPSIGKSETNSSTATTTYAPYVGDNAEKIIWKTLYNSIRNAYGVAGVMGNMRAESGLVPYRMEGDIGDTNFTKSKKYTGRVNNGEISRYQFSHDAVGYGLVQWTWYSYKQELYDYAKKQGKSVGDLTIQLQFLISVLSSGEFKSLWNTLRSAKSVAEASNAFLLQFERPADQSVEVQRQRAGFGQQYYNKYYSLTLRGAPR